MLEDPVHRSLFRSLVTALDPALIFAGREADVHRAHRPAANKAGRDEIPPLFHHFEMVGQRAVHRRNGEALFNVEIDDYVLARSMLLLCEHFVDQGQLPIFNR